MTTVFFLLKMTTASVLLLFAAYVVHVEPNVSTDPYGATTRAVHRLGSLCERNPQECEFAAKTAKNVSRAGEIGWGLITGSGRLVYIPDNGRPENFGDNRYGSRSATDGRNTGSGLSITGLLNGSGFSAFGSGNTASRNDSSESGDFWGRNSNALRCP